MKRPRQFLKPLKPSFREQRQEVKEFWDDQKKIDRMAPEYQAAARVLGSWGKDAPSDLVRTLVDEVKQAMAQAELSNDGDNPDRSYKDEAIAEIADEVQKRREELGHEDRPEPIRS